MPTKQSLESHISALQATIRDLRNADERSQNRIKTLEMQLATDALPDMERGSRDAELHNIKVLDSVNARVTALADWAERNYGSKVEDYERRAVGAGNLLAMMLGWGASDILLAAAVALVDSNYSDEAAQVRAMYDDMTASFEVINVDDMTPDERAAFLDTLSPAERAEVEAALADEPADATASIIDPVKLEQAQQEAAEVRDRLSAQEQADRDILQRVSAAGAAYRLVMEVWGIDHDLTKHAWREYLALDTDARPAQVRRSQRMMQEQLDSGALSPEELKSITD